ncbi:MAG: hypothetical protein C0518_14530 [Opitutus sp.]|nr:hypothetical protein [Opitutus sp.]
MSSPAKPVAVGLAVAALVAAGFAWRAQRAATIAETRAAALDRELTDTKTALKKSQERADALAAKAVELDNQLGSVKTRATATATKSSQLNRELASVKSTLSERQQREVALLAEIETLRQKISTPAPQPIPAVVPPSAASVVAEAPTRAASTSSAELEDYRGRISALEEQLTALLARALSEPPAQSTPASSDLTPAAHSAPITPAFVVVRVGPRDAFVVLDYGADHGATSGEFATLARGTSEVGRVQISDVRPRFSVAQVVSPPRKGQLQTGDIVLLAR